ncbi:hypothetical protein ACFXA3_32810, partial [Streptomyces sp. NPDC059456]|uniref:hypothetical protein n=1 Tax=Streptomyces sp. NPDC059456 TaxID=3346838 RepID=UPI0036C57150
APRGGRAGPGSGAVTTISVLDGGRIGRPDDFRTLMAEAVNGPGGCLGRSLGSFTDCLRGGFGTPDDGGSVVERRDHELSRRALGHPETARRPEGVLARCRPTNRERVAEELAQARSGRGPTLFDVLAEIIEDQPPGLRPRRPRGLTYPFARRGGRLARWGVSAHPTICRTVSLG